MLVGRPNVGKSTLFNRICGSRRAIVTSVPGTTRDLLNQDVEWLGTNFELVDTGGLFGASADPLRNEVTSLGLQALSSANVIVQVVDGTDGLVPADEEVASHARRVGSPVVLVVNKIDKSKARDRVGEFHQLGVAPVVSIAAEHGMGVGDLLDEIVAKLPGRKASGSRVAAEVDRQGAGEIRVAIIGRPNVGKSSLVNLLTQEERVLVSAEAGTTRDFVDVRLAWHGRQFRLVDTAGIRRPGRVHRSGPVESVSVVMARRAVSEADVAVLVVDAANPISRQDAVIAGEAERAGCGIVLAANKWDLVKGQGADFYRVFDADLRDAIKFADFAPVMHISALTGERTPKLIEKIYDVAQAREMHVGTGELNRFVDRATKRHPPANLGRREVKIKYVAQVATRPPTFVFFTNIVTRFHFSYERFLRNQIRSEFGFEGTPIRLRVRTGRDKSHESKRG